METIGLNLEELVLFELKTRRKSCSSLKSWINKFVRGLLVKLGYGVPLLVITNLPLKFGSKRSTLKFWIFRPRAQCLDCSPLELEITLENKSNGIWKFQVDMSSTRRDEQNPEIISKAEDFGFSAKFLSKLSFCKNQGDFLLTQWKKVAINSIRNIKNFNFN